MASPSGRRHQSPAATAQNSAMVRRSYGRDAAAHRKMGDGWMMLSEPPGPKAVAEFDKLRRLVEAEGRDPASVGLEVWTSTGTGTEKDWREEISFWKQAG